MNNINNPIKIKNIKEINESFSLCSLDNIFTAFKSINNIFYLVYATKNKSIIIYNLVNDTKIVEIKKAHKEFITNFRHHQDEKNKRDLLISISSGDNNIKLWNLNDLECLLDIKQIYKEGFINSACFLEEEYNNQIYIIASNFNFNTFEGIKVINSNGKEIKQINNSNDKTYIISSYYDDITNKNYIATGNVGHIKSFDFQENKLYNNYYDDNKKAHFSIIFHLNKDKKILELIDSCYDGLIRIWNFHTAELINKINFDFAINSIFLFNDNYIFVSCYDKTIKIVNLKKEIVEDFCGNNKDIISLYAIGQTQNENYLITQGFEEDPLTIYNLEI